MNSISLSDDLFQGHISLEHNENGVCPWRIPHRQRALFPPDGLRDNAQTPAGVRLRFITDAHTVSLGVKLTPNDAFACHFDLVENNEILESLPFTETEGDVTFSGLGGGERTLEIWLPQRHNVDIVYFRVNDGATARSVPDRRTRWVTYGSSITHCARAHSPARTWPSIVARRANLHLTCLGYGGQCHLDSMIARMIRDHPADFISLKLGINVNGSGSLGPRAFQPAVIGFINIIREQHPDIPIAVISPIYSFARETKENLAGMNLADMRDQLYEAVTILQNEGDTCLTYHDGLKMIDHDEALFPDQLHPNGDGYEMMGERIYRQVVSPILGPARSTVDSV